MQPVRTIDPRIVHRAQQGDAAAREELVRSLGPSVWSLCRRLGRVPEDAYQTTWEKVFSALHRFEPDRQGSLKAWVLTIARRHLIDRHRRNRIRDNVVHLDELAVHPRIDEALDQRSRQERLEDALTRLPEPQRRVIVFHHLNGVPLTDIAAEEGVAVGTVKSRLHRARARLLSLLEGT
jgi:RNA polymerase sigma-70 factor (ECF subfamily)